MFKVTECLEKPTVFDPMSSVCLMCLHNGRLLSLGNLVYI